MSNPVIHLTDETTVFAIWFIELIARLPNALCYNQVVEINDH